jgi:hypothetical protein
MTKTGNVRAIAITQLAIRPDDQAAMMIGFRPIRSARYPAGICASIIANPNALKTVAMVIVLAPNCCK